MVWKKKLTNEEPRKAFYVVGPIIKLKCYTMLCASPGGSRVKYNLVYQLRSQISCTVQKYYPLHYKLNVNFSFFIYPKINVNLTAKQ